MNQKSEFFSLTPERVLDAVESLGLRCTGFCMALNSYENRVYEVEVEMEDSRPPQNRRVVKFYRPGRWTREQILEEHAFIYDLLEYEIPAVAPVRFEDGSTLRACPSSGIFYTVFPKVGGRSPDELAEDRLRRLGRLLGRMHGAGAAKKAVHRLRLGADTYGRSELDFLLNGNWIIPDFVSRYRAAAESIIAVAGPMLANAPFQRLHGDCHFGNILWNDDGPFFVDFDDMLSGPPVQDIWLVLPGRGMDAVGALGALLAGYEEMRSFDRSTLALIEPLRGLRMIRYGAWIARRWDDPSFPRAFPEFGSHRYWSEETEALERQSRLALDL